MAKKNGHEESMGNHSPGKREKGEHYQKGQETVLQTPDFNYPQLRGQAPGKVQEKFGVQVEILGPWDEDLKAYPITIKGPGDKVVAYLSYLRSTWPQQQ